VVTDYAMIDNAVSDSAKTANFSVGHREQRSLMALKSGLYTGWVRHRRFEPRIHTFKYRVFMMYLDLDEVEQVMSLSPVWRYENNEGLPLAVFRRSDFLGDPDKPLRHEVLATVKRKSGLDIDGPVRMLANLRYFGLVFNPLTVYYCFDKNEVLQALLLEVTNTPWREKQQYVLQADPDKTTQRISFEKQMHVSPFHPMNMTYHFHGNVPTKQIVIHLQNTMNDSSDNHLNGGKPTKETACGCAKTTMSDSVDSMGRTAMANDSIRCNTSVFDATLCLKRTMITPGVLTRVMLSYPLMTLKVVAGIYWQALLLVLKRIPIYGHKKSVVESG